MVKMITAVAALTAGIALADVTSQNVVGYNTKNLQAETWYIVSFQFAGVGDNATVDLNKVFKSSGIKATSWNDGDCDNGRSAEIQVRQKNGTYKHYYYISDGTDLDDEDLGYDCWCDADGYPLDTDDIIALGNGAWMYIPNYSTLAGETPSISVSGEVFAQATLGVDVVGNLEWNLIGNPWPIALDLNTKLDMEGFIPGSWNDGDCDTGNCTEIQVRQLNGTYKHFYYISDGTDLDDEDLGYDCWCDADGYPPEGAAMQSLEGAWMRVRTTDNEVTVPFSK